MLKHLPNEVGIISSHPMFGPDSFDSKARLKMMMDKTRVDDKILIIGKHFLKIKI